MRLADNYVEHLHGAEIICVGTHNEVSLSDIQLVHGVLVSPDREDITIYVLESQGSVLLQNLKSTGKFVLTAANSLTFETYQFKGTYISHGPSDVKDEVIQSIYVDKLNAAINPMWPAASEHRVQLVLKPMISIVLQVDELSEQND
jgi:hypothetical protein